MAMTGIAISLFNNILAIFKSVTGTYVMFGVFLAAVIYILFAKGKRETFVFSITAIVILVLFFNPAVFWLFGKKMLGDQTYCRMLWTIPQVVIIAYALTDICGRFDKQKLKQAGAVLLCICALMISGHIIYTRDNFEIRENIYGFSDDLMEALDAIEPCDDPDRKTRISAEPDIIGKLRQIRTDIYPKYDRLGFDRGAKKAIYDEFLMEEPDIEHLVQGAYNYHSYLLIYRYHDSSKFNEMGCKAVCENETYILYCLDDVSREYLYLP